MSESVAGKYWEDPPDDSGDWEKVDDCSGSDASSIYWVKKEKPEPDWNW